MWDVQQHKVNGPYSFHLKVGNWRAIVSLRENLCCGERWHIQIWHTKKPKAPTLDTYDSGEGGHDLASDAMRRADEWVKDHPESGLP